MKKESFMRSLRKIKGLFVPLAVLAALARTRKRRAALLSAALLLFPTFGCADSDKPAENPHGDWFDAFIPNEQEFGEKETNESEIAEHEANVSVSDEAGELFTPRDTGGDLSEGQNTTGVSESFDLEAFLREERVTLSLSEIPPYVGYPYTAVHDNVPYFSVDSLMTVPFESYGEPDESGRCTGAYACLSRELMPTEKRGSIGSVKPSGWQTVRYDCVDGGYLYNRCHLIAYQLTAENANEKNLITGTRYMNVEGMLPFEDLTADYIRENENVHVLYRATPLFDGDNLLADGVLLEAMSVEDAGEAICFCIFCYNVQPGISIDYATGESREIADLTFSSVGSELLPDESSEKESVAEDERDEYILNTKSKKFHRTTCGGAKSTAQANRRDYVGSREALIADGYTPCENCKP